MNGKWTCSLDAKGRLAVPSKLRIELGERFYVTKGVDSCLSVYSEDGWREMAERISRMPSARARVLRRTLFANALVCEPDSQGRIIISKELREYASLGREVTFIGADKNAEIWNCEKWEAYDAAVSEEEFAAAFDSIDE